jgi:two-component system, CitB family, sensor kinase
VTTKGSGRGFGLALLSKMIISIGGQLSISSSEEGASLKASLPM